MKYLRALNRTTEYNAALGIMNTPIGLTVPIRFAASIGGHLIVSTGLAECDVGSDRRVDGCLGLPNFIT